MDIRVLRYFLGVARESNITKAAEAMHITQPTLSRQISNLEDELGVTLIERRKNGIVLTEEGMLLRRRAEEIVELAEKAEREISERRETIEGTVSIGSGELAAVSLLPKIFTSFREKYPKVQFEMYAGNADLIKERIDNGLTDIGILLEPVEISKYDFLRLPVKEHWVVLMRPDSPLAKKELVTTEDLITLPLIFVKRSNVSSELRSWFGGRFDELNIVATNNMSTNSAVLVSQGFGYALVVEGSVPFLDTSKVCSRRLDPDRTATTVLAWKKNQPLSPSVRKFLQHFRDEITEIESRSCRSDIQKTYE